MKKVNVPEGESGSWKVEKFTISEDQSSMSIFRYGSRAPLPGTYTRLLHKGRMVMSDTVAEMRDHAQAVKQAKGHVLINGLGIGMVLLNCMEKPKVRRATVIEKSADVIKLVGPHYQAMYGNRLEIILADALTWAPPKGVKYGMVWHDIWPDICADNLEQMKTLHRRYGRRCDWQGSWSREIVEKMVRETRREEQRDRAFFANECKELDEAVNA